MLMSGEFWGTIGDFYEFSEIKYDGKVTYQIWRLYHFCSNIKPEKKEFSEFNRKTVNRAEKETTGDPFMDLF